MKTKLKNILTVLLALTLLTQPLATALATPSHDCEHEDHNFSEMTFEEILTTISDELIDILYDFNIELTYPEDLELLIDLDENHEIWGYLNDLEDCCPYKELNAIIDALNDTETEVDYDFEETEYTENEDCCDDDEEDYIIDEDFSTDYPETEEANYETSPEDVTLTEPSNITLNPTGVEITATSTNNTAQIHQIRRPGVIVANGQLRSASNSSARVLRNITTNTNVRINRRQGSWYEITTGGRTGWIERNRIARSSQFGVVTSSNVAIRNSRSNNSRVLTRASRGTRVRITRRTGSWSRVTVNNRTGWIRNSQVNINRGRPARITRQSDIRVLPSANSNITRRIPANTQVVQLQRTTSGWTQIELRHANGTLRGWTQAASVSNQNHSRRITSSNVALRNRPSGNGNVVRRLNRNTSVTVRAVTGNWSYISVSGTRGWVRNSQLSRLRLPSAIHDWTWVETESARPAIPGTPAVPPVYEETEGRWMVFCTRCGRAFENAAGWQDHINNPNTDCTFANASRTTQWQPGERTLITPGVPATPGTPARAARGHWRCRITGRTTRTGTRSETDPR